MSKSKKPSDQYLSEVSTRIANGIRKLMAEEFEQVIADGYDPFYLRYGALVGHLMSMGDLIGTSADPEDRQEMREFIDGNGNGLLLKHSEMVAKMAGNEEKKPENFN